MVEDIENEVEQEERIINTYRRAHRNAEENRLQTLENFYSYYNMTAKITKEERKIIMRDIQTNPALIQFPYQTTQRTPSILTYLP